MAASVTASQNENLCPLCGWPNQCAQQAGRPAASCWCLQRPALGSDWLARNLPPGTPVQCLCPACHARLEAEKARQSAETCQGPPAA